MSKQGQTVEIGMNRNNEFKLVKFIFVQIH